MIFKVRYLFADKICFKFISHLKGDIYGDIINQKFFLCQQMLMNVAWDFIIVTNMQFVPIQVVVSVVIVLRLVFEAMAFIAKVWIRSLYISFHLVIISKVYSFKLERRHFFM